MLIKQLKRQLLLAVSCLVCILPASAQVRDVAGIVVDSGNSPVAGAFVLNQATGAGVMTGADGRFIVSAGNSDILVVSCMSYRDTAVKAGASGNLTIVLEDESLFLDEVVVTALGISRESKSLSYNVQKIDGDALAIAKDVNIMSGLGGKVAGVQINSGASGIGGGTRVVMRGTKSISGNNNALYVVDGIPVSNVASEQPGDQYTGAGQTGDVMSQINADDIESISVLNGSAAAALYGSAAANGVVLITTRKGAAGRLSLSYANSTSFYDPFILPRFQNEYGSETGEWMSWNTVKMSTASGYDVKDFFQTGYNESNTISLSTGNQKNQTYLSAGAVNSRGIIQNNTLDRYTFTGRNTSEFLDGRFTLDLSAMYTRVREQNMLSQGEYANPLVPVYLFPRGDDIEKYKYYERYDIGRNIMTQFWPLGDNGLSMQNPWWITNRNMYNTSKDRFLLGASIKYKATGWLELSARTKYDREDISSEKRMYASTMSVLSENSTRGSYLGSEICNTQIYADVMANVNKYFLDDAISLTAVAGASMLDLVHSELSSGGGLLTLPNVFTAANVNTAGKFTYKQNDWHDRTNSLFATVSLGYRSMVYVDASVRNDWMSALAYTKHRSIVYPSVGASAIITEMIGRKSKAISLAKVRVSYSEVGNAPERFMALTTYPLAGGLSTSSYFPAVDLQPERTKSWEAGVNLGFFENRLTLDVTGYISRTYNQLFSPSISSTTGYTKLYVNAGEVTNRGIEASLNSAFDFGEFHWGSTLLYTLNRNRVDQLLPSYTNDALGVTVKLDHMDVYNLGGVKQMLSIGGTMGDIYVNKMRTDEHGYVWVNSMTNAMETMRNEWVKAGTSNPDCTLSWRNILAWKGLSLSFMINARIGGVGVSATQAVLDYYGVSEDTAKARTDGGVQVNDRYSVDAQTWYQTIGGNGANFIGAYYVYSLTNVRLGEMSVGYDIPVSKYIKSIRNVNLSVFGKNLLMIYCSAPFDPEVTASTGTYNQAIDYFMQPSLRNIGFSVKITL